ncbi:MAG: hypothetical protein EBV64_11835 [Oxalobacteraceae bacterium]|nr:hypothetical protein [Oxalobacteraceae bacterium]
MPPAKRATQLDADSLTLPDKPLVGVYAKLAWVQAHIAHLPKTGRAKFGEYFQEHSALSLLRVWQRELLFAVVVDFPAHREDGDERFLVTRVAMIDVEQPPESDLFKVEAVYPIEATNRQGFGYATAQTYGKKFALHKFFSMPAEEIPEQEGAPSETPAVKGSEKVAAERARMQQDVIAAAANDPAFIERFKAYIQTVHGVDKSDKMSTLKSVKEAREWIVEQTSNGPSVA